MSKNIVRVNKTNNYTVMSNHHLRNENLSWKAKGIHSYILSLPDDWKVVLEHLKKVSLDKERSTRSGIKELYDLRYWQKYPVYVDGLIDQWVTEIYEEPFPESDLIKSIVFKDSKKIINYENEEIDVKDDNLLVHNSQVVEDTDSELLVQNVDVALVDVDSAGLLNTNTTKDLSFTNHSFIQEDKKESENERMNDDTDKLEEIFKQANIDYFTDCFISPKAIKRSIETLWFRTKPLITNNMEIPAEKLRSDLSDLTAKDIELGIETFSEQARHQKINNKTSYLGVCIYNSMFDGDLKIHNTLKLNGSI